MRNFGFDPEATPPAFTDMELGLLGPLGRKAGWEPFLVLGLLEVLGLFGLFGLAGIVAANVTEG